MSRCSCARFHGRKLSRGRFDQTPAILAGVMQTLVCRQVLKCTGSRRNEISLRVFNSKRVEHSTQCTEFKQFFRTFSKMLQMLSKGSTNISDHFPKISEDCPRLPKMSEDLRFTISFYRRCTP